MRERPPSPGPGIVEQLEAAGVVLRADGDDIVVRPLRLLSPELRALVVEQRDAVLAALRARDIMGMTRRACTDCARLERGVHCSHYMRVMPEPARECRCAHFRAALPW